ncbi:hypothetical protein S40293_00550 [Stachybotrys chartarum IBT 40293]|nr:hypothetical protein S40293_00550 [Stachybotrys chartarum IBT 40293]
MPSLVPLHAVALVTPDIASKFVHRPSPSHVRAGQLAFAAVISRLQTAGATTTARNGALFVAPVESDLPCKVAQKGDPTSPARSTIRRPGYYDPRHGPRRAGTSVRIFNSRHRQDAARIGGTPADGTRMTRLVPDGPASPPAHDGWPDARIIADGDVNGRPLREALREMTRHERLQEHMTNLFGRHWRDSVSNPPLHDPNAHSTVGLLVPIEPRSHGGTSASTTTDPVRPRNDSTPGPGSSTYTSAQSLQASLRQQARNRARMMRRDPRTSVQIPRDDGLGDRRRSLSPEVWDTLLSTLTPDPQPPSASSSFVSQVASQNAGPSSTSSAPTAAASNEQAADNPCEPAPEDADEDSLVGNALPPDAYASLSHSDLRNQITPSAHWMRMNPDEHASGLMRTGPSDENRAVGIDLTTSNPPSWRSGSAPTWAGRYSYLDSDAHLPGRRDRPLPASQLSHSSGGDEDWQGMRRIVRSLARREDIPDEWWAEAGLSRTLPQDDVN